MTPQERSRAGRAVQERIYERGKTITQVAREAQLDPKTIYGLIRGERWPRADAIARIEAALDWCPGEIYRRGRDGLESLHGYTSRDLLSELLARERLLDPGNTRVRGE